MTTRPMAQRRIRRRGRVAAGLGTLLLVAALAACGDDAGEEEPAELEPASQQDAQLAFHQCLRDNGLEVSDPDTSGGGPFVAGPGGLGEAIDFDNPAEMAVVEQCSEEHLGNIGGRGEFGDNLADPDDLIAYVDCMRGHGIDMPDPGADGTLYLPEGIDPQSSEFQGAAQDCGEHLSGGGIRIERGGDGPRGTVVR